MACARATERELDIRAISVIAARSRSLSTRFAVPACHVAPSRRRFAGAFFARRVGQPIKKRRERKRERGEKISPANKSMIDGRA